MADRVDGFLARMLEQNRDPYLAHRVKPAVEALRAGNFAAARGLARTSDELFANPARASLSGARMAVNPKDQLCWQGRLR
jgi:hypothetical protein